MKRTILIISLLAVTSCQLSRRIVEVPVKSETTIIERLIPVTVPPDSSVFNALFECDSSYNVLLKSFNEIKSNHVQSDINFTSNRLTYRTLTVHDTIYIRQTDTIRLTEIPVIQEIPYYITELSKTKRTIIAIALLIIVVTLFKFIIKKHKSLLIK